MNKNLLTMVPAVKDHIVLKQLDNTLTCCVCIPRTNWIEKISIRFFKQPEHHTIQLDRLGSFIMLLCNGRNGVEELEEKLWKRFGQEASPIRDRLLAFLSIVEANGWIEWREP